MRNFSFQAIILLSFTFAASVLLLFCTRIVCAEQLPIKTYFSTDGLVYDKVYRTFYDSRGFVWFFTPIGISRFDGYRFVSYGMEDGLEDSSLVTDAIEDENGVYWFASVPRGVFRFDPRPKTEGENQTTAAHFELISVSDDPESNKIRRIYKTRKNEILIGSLGAIYRLVPGEKRFERFDLNLDAALEKPLFAQDFAEDADGSLWIGHQYGLSRRLPSGAIINYEIDPQANGTDRVLSVAVDANNRVWILTDVGRRILVFNPEPVEAIETNAGGKRTLKLRPEAKIAADVPRGFAHVFSTDETLADAKTINLDATRDGSVWLSAFGKGLVEYNGREFRLYTKENGLSDTTVRSVMEDGFGNLWISSDWGAMRWNRTNFVSFHTEDGLGDERVCGIFEDRSAALYVMTPNWTINRYEENRFNPIKLNLPPVNNYIADRVLSDHTGDWWFATGDGLYRFAPIDKIEQLTNATPIKIYTTTDNLPGKRIHFVQEDSSRNVWFSYDEKPGFLTRWRRETNELETFTAADGIPDSCVPQTLREDGAGNLYFPCFIENILIFQNNRFRAFTHEAFDKKFWISDIIVDRKGALWAATPTKGLLKVENIISGNPTVTSYTNANGLSSNSGQFLTEDNQGRIYYLNARALDVLEPGTGQIKKYTLADGLNGTGNGTAYRDRRGDLWFGTHRGVSKLSPQNSREKVSPPIYISSLRAGGKNVPLNALGETNIENLTLEADARQMQIEFFGLSLATGESLRYQYKLEGADADWNEATAERTANYPNIAPGSYRFLVRAVSSDNLTSERPAVVSFTVLRPVWQRWWFLLLVAASVSAAIYAIYRSRIKQIIRLERVRTRIATDLHDDIGSSLSQIAILSEVVRQKVGETQANEPLNLIADTSREMVDSMSDIVWAINPNKDSLRDLVQRMRRFAGDMLDSKDIAYRFVIPENLKQVALGADVRREVYLIFKECINNLTKYSGASEATIEIKIENHAFVCKIVDNGRGFDAAQVLSGGSNSFGGNGFGGNGLPNMRRRAAALSGKFEIVSSVGEGAAIRLEVPLRQSG